ncbi:MAG: ribonuclease J, partial [Merdibacter sp.]
MAASISTYFQSLFRIQEILDIAIKYRKKIYIHDDGLLHVLRSWRKMKYYHVPKELLVDRRNFSNAMEDVLVIISGQGKNLFRTMSNIANQEDRYVRFRSSDTIIIASPIVSGTQMDANNMENEIYKEGGTIFSLDSRQVLSMHPSREDLKMMLYLFKPKYYIPV